MDGWRAERALISRSQSFAPAVTPLTIQIWQLPPFTFPSSSLPFHSLCSAASVSLSFALYISFFLSPPPTRAPSPLFSRCLISRAASQQEYLRKEKAPLLYSLFRTPLPHISLCSRLLLFPLFSSHIFLLHSSFSNFFIPNSSWCCLLHNNHSACVRICLYLFKCARRDGTVVVFNYTAGELLLSHSN